MECHRALDPQNVEQPAVSVHQTVEMRIRRVAAGPNNSSSNIAQYLRRVSCFGKGAPRISASDVRDHAREGVAEGVVIVLTGGDSHREVGNVIAHVMMFSSLSPGTSPSIASYQS